MRKNNMRKWFHLIIDFIPLFIIPIFAININQKSVEPISITVGGDYIVKNKYETNEINSIDDLIENNVYHFDDFEITNYYDEFSFGMYVLNVDIFNFYQSKYTIDEIYTEEYNSNEYNTISISVGLEYGDTSNFYINFTNSNSYVSLAATGSFTEDEIMITLENVDFYIGYGLEDFKKYIGDDFLGILPTSSDFEVLEYVYEDEIVYDNTDIGSQFIYSLYKPVHDYFNISELGGFNQFYQWIEINFFNGTAPLPFFIVFNIMMYNFIIDMIFLLYSVFMFFIDFAENCLNRFYPR